MRYIGFIFALCLSIQAIASNIITLSSVSGTPQTEVEVVVSLDNTDAITALELNIPLGEHLSYVDGSTVLASSRSNGHLLTATQVQQELRICVYSLNLSALQGNNGELLSFRLKLGNEPATYTLTPSVILSDTRGQSLDSNVQSGQVSILAPKLEILNPQIDYGHIPIRETYTQDLQLYNAGNLPLIIEDIVVNDPAFTPAQTALTIEVGEVAYTTIHYAPTVRGAIQKEVVVTSNAINGKQMGTIVADPFSVNELHVVGGSGIADNAVTISLKMNNMEPIVGVQCTFVLPEQLEYIAGSLSANSSRSNGHQAMASVKKFVEKENQWYDSKGDTLVLMLYSMANQPLNGNDGEIATFQVRLNGNSGSYALTPRDVVLTNATAENMVSATSEGWVEIQSPQFSGDDYLSFGDWSITDDIVANYVVRNRGDAPLEIERVRFLAQGYRVVSTMPLQINPWEESTMQIAYDPAAEGDFSTTMNIYTNDPTTRMKAVAVSGHVYEPNTLSVDGERMQDGSYQLAISLDNYTNIVGVQYDIHWRSDMTTSQAAFTPTARLQNHTYAIMPIGKNTYRVLIYSLSNTPITGKEGELHQLLFTSQGDVDYCGDVLTIDNIVLSNANGTDKVSQSTVLHHLPTTQYSEQTITACDQYVYNNKVYQSSGTYIDTLQTVGGCDSIVTTYLTINRSEREEYYETACDEYWWHDNRYTESGDYTYHTTAWNGCERVEILHLTINRSEREEYWETACDAYEWHGQYYYESGDYEYYTTTDQGCERVEVLHLTINRSEREEYWETACDAYEWHGQYYYESGDYEYYTTTDQGCERVEVLHLTINRSERQEYNVTACDQYEWHGEVYTESGTYEYHTTTDQGCERVEVLHLTINRSEREEYWETACDAYEWHGQYYYESGDYEYYTTTDQDCERVEVLHLTINRSEREEFNTTSCDSYEWHGKVYTESGDYEYRTTTEQGCERVEVLHLTINHPEYEEYYVTVCKSYEWHGEVYREAGDYTYETTTTHGCQRTEVLHLTLSDIEHEEFTVSTCEEYWWHDTQYTESGDYEYYTTTDEGCERLEILHLTINHNEREEFNVSACESYEWHGNTYYSSGTYEHYTTTEHGCDRVEVLYLTINRSEHEEYWETACDSYEWHGKVYTESGDYEHYTTTEHGCERVEVLHLSINKSEREEYTATACNQYEWHGQVYTESGAYEYRTNTDAGCEHLEILHLTINHNEREEFNVSACESYEWHGNTYYDSGTYEHYTTTDAGCERVEVLHLTIHHSEYEEYYVTVCDSYEWHGEVYREAGDYTYETTTAHGCPRTEVLHLTLSDREYEEYNVTACDQYEWHGEVYTESGDYTFNTISSSGCERTEVLHLTIFYSEHEEYNITACDSYEWNGETYTESGDYEYRTTIEETTEKLYVGYNAQNDPIIGLVPPRGVSKFTVDGYITQGAGTCFVGTGTPADEVADEADLRIFDAGCFYYDRMSGRNSCFFYDYREPFNIEFGNYYAKNLETGEYYFNEGNNVYEYSNTEYPLTLFHNDYGKIHKVQFFDNNNLLWADINAVIEGEVPMITIDYYNQDGSIYHTQQFTENLHAETKTITEQGCERVEVLHLTINRSEREEYWETACDAYEWHGNTYTESGDYEHYTTTEHGCERVEVLHLTINRSEREEYYEYACDSYEWHGQVYTESGTYEYHTTTDQGCERLEVLYLTIYNSQYEEYWETACDEYWWNGNQYTESGDYTYSFVIADWGSGYCERTEVLHLTINHREREEYWATACDEYFWDRNGNTYYDSGDYEHYTTTEHGCERVEILHLTINRSEYEDYWERACDQYEWHGEVYTASGDYEYRTTTADGCERVEVLHLTIYNSEYEDYWVTACDEYWWNNNQYTESGDYTYSFVRVDWGSGYCERTEVLHLTINKRDTVHYYETACDRYYWNNNGNEYYESSDYENYTTNEYGCERVEILHLTINHSEREEYWENACDAYEWHGNTYTESGDYEYRTTLENGCERVEVLHLTINRSEREEYNVTACDQYEWHGEVYTESGTYEYHTTTDQGCERVEVLYLTISDREHEEYYETACDEFYWDHNGQYYYESGDYIFNTTAANGCERTEVLHLTINHSEHQEYYENACDAYEWHGETYTQSGNYEYRTTLENGCERVEVLHLTIYNSQYEEYWETACDEYWWNGEIYTESGDYTYSYPLYNWGTGTCDRTEVLHLTINKSEREEYWATACDEYYWDRDGNTYYDSGDYEHYTTTEQGCERVEVLHLTINRSEREEYWETACDSYEWYGQVYTASGDYEYRTTTEQGCERVEVLHLTINKSEREEYYETACDEYWWWRDGNTYYESGTYEYHTTTGDGCERTEVLHLTINKRDTVHYYETACDEYWWDPYGLYYNTSGNYECYTTNEYGCERVEVLHLTINRSEREEYWETACDSYEWYGQVYTASGDYEYRTTTEQGCERVEVLHLSINKSEREEYTATACDQYEWYGQVYTESGDYEYYTTTEQGCERVEVLHLTINRSEREEYYETACDEFYWDRNGETYYESGEYEHYTTTEQGCERVEVLHLTINRSEREEYYETACDEFYWDRNGETYYESGDYTFNTTTEQGCERIEVLHLTINKSERVEETVTSCDSYEWNGLVYTESGDYEHYTTTEQGCERIEVLHLTILPEATIESEELALCPSELPYEWYGQSLTEEGTYSATEQYAGMECDSVIHELTLNVYVQTLPATVTLPIVRTGEAIDVTTPTAEIQAHIAAETWYAPNAEVAWYILENSDWTALTDEPVAASITEVIIKYAVETDCGNIESDKMVIAIEPTGVENTNSPSPISNCRKILYEDHIYILREGKVYSVMGHEL